MTECKNEIRNLKSIVSERALRLRWIVMIPIPRFYPRIVSNVDPHLPVNEPIASFPSSSDRLSLDSPGFPRSESHSTWIRGGGGSHAGHMSDDGGVSTPLRYKKTSAIRKPQQVQSSIVQRSVSSTLSSNKNVMTPLRSKATSSMSAVTSKYATPMRTALTSTKKVVLKNIKSSGYGQFTAINNTTTTIKKQQQQQLATLATPGRSFRK